MFKLTIQGAGISFSADIPKDDAVNYMRNIIEQHDKPETDKPKLVDSFTEKQDGEPP